MRLATWNVNSIRTRVERVTDWLARGDVDVLAMQETKCTDSQFPALAFEALGYEIAHVGYNQWNGVAIASRVGLDDVTIGFDGQPGFAKDGADPEVEARAIGATCAGVRVWSLYIPNGRSLTDPHLAYKLEWLAALRNCASERLAAEPDQPIALVGDWNIVPQDDDVWDITAFEGKTHVSPPERAAFAAMQDAGFTDVVRPYTPGPGVYTYWDYTQLAFQKRRGMRIDFILGSPALAARVTGAEIVKDERRPKKGTTAPSDHAPVLIELD